MLMIEHNKSDGTSSRSKEINSGGEGDLGYLRLLTCVEVFGIVADVVLCKSRAAKGAEIE